MLVRIRPSFTFLSKPISIRVAFLYAGGDTEPILGTSLNAAASNELLIGSKAHPSQPGGLTPEGLRMQLDTSLKAIGVARLDEFYLHQPDTAASLLDSLRTTDAFVREGLVGKVGLSNYHADEVKRCMELCEEHNLIKPAVYQGL